MNIRDMTPPDRIAETTDLFRRLAAGETVSSFETQRLTKDGRILDVWLTATAVWDEAGKIVEALATTERDITERKKAEDAQGRLAAIVESAEVAIIGKDLNGIIQTWNVGAEHIFGYNAEEIIGKSISLLVPAGHFDEMPEILLRIKQGEHIENFETLRLRKDGTVIPVSLKFSAIKDASGKVIGASKIAHDITDRKVAEEAVRRSNEELTRFNRAMVGREKRMIEMKKEINELCTRAGLPPRYKLDFEKKQA